MTLKKSSRDPFASLFWSSAKKTCFVPIVTLAIFLLNTLLNTISVLSDASYRDFTYTADDGTFVIAGFFWDFIITGIIPTALLILGGFIAATVLFFFAQSKKQCNVIFSLGLSRRRIFLAKYLGGILPFAAALIFSAMLELLSNVICGCFIGLPTVHFALLTVTTMIAVYTLAFTVTAATTAFSGNIVESLIFTAVIGFFPNISCVFFENMRGAFTYGGTFTYEGDWNFFNPFASFIMVMNKFSFNPYSSRDYVDALYTGKVTLSRFDWSGAITAFVLTAVVLTICLLTFPKRRNEISGQFGRAKGLNGICGAMVAFYAGTVALLLSLKSNARDIGILISVIITFAVVYLIFKLIFARRKKQALVQSAKRLIAYTAAFAAVTGIFSTGLFGYSSYVPKAEDVRHLEVSFDLTNPYISNNSDIGVHSGQLFGYAEMCNYSAFNADFEESFTHDYFYSNTYSVTALVEGDDVAKVMELHSSLAKQGKLRANNDNVCGYGFRIEYTLNNDKTVKRYYTSMSLENAIKVLGLSDLPDIKERVSDYFTYSSFSTDETGDAFYNTYFIFSKDLKSYKYVDSLPDEFKNAILADLENLTAQQIFFHKPEDELGVIKFLTFDFAQDYMKLNPGEYISSNGFISDSETDDYIDNVENRTKELSITKKPFISVSGCNCIVVTKDMKNTVKYLTDNDLMQYFKPTVTADDVKEIKIATRAESVGRKNSEMLPFFAAAYAPEEEIQEEIDDGQEFVHHFAENIKDSITDNKIIQTVLDNAQLYGYNGNDDRIVEVSFNDGSIATYAISAEVYSKLNIK